VEGRQSDRHNLLVSDVFVFFSPLTKENFSDGATASGLFVALAHLLEKINYEQICDVFSAARTVRQGREEFVQDWVIIVVGRNNCGNFLFQAQIEFLYKAAKVYVEEFDNYDNFNE
jgi:hypothetical protein